MKSNFISILVYEIIHVSSIPSRESFGKLSGKAAAGYALLISILVFGCGAQSTKADPTVTATATTPTSLITTSPAATLDLKVALRENIDHVLGRDARNLSRLTKVSYSDPERGDITIIWTINANGSQNSTKAAAQIDAVNILKVLVKSNSRFIYVILIGTFSAQDKYGNTTEIQVINLGFNKSRLDKIDWGNFQSSDIYNLADVAIVADEWK